MEFLSENWTAGVEILILWIGLYQIYRVFRKTRGARILLGLALLLMVLSSVSLLLDLKVIWWLLYKVLALMAFGLIVIFQPELRNALARLGSSRLFSFSQTQRHEFLDTFADAVGQLSKKRIGALFAFERAISLKDHLETGVELDAVFSPEFALTVFHPKTALHDGGMIIAQNRVAGAGCVFPVSSRELADRSTGLRHRAAIGLTEETDCVAVVVSEETGQISICVDGKLDRGLTEEEFREAMESIFLPKEQNNDEEDVEETLAGEADDADRRGDDLVPD
ncbi:TIGR00159 family protein [Verrucomicrobiaceae bacterium R5-34]|uniref:Diadenylate cyclase n=1 Tax=Oceaniferula flava TaxID=2800421 RepID=A0AAE2SBS4_9BACT|nr:diadenylate cyclase CdaA [Oceaniferula flavus]MBK1832033.1 TIGR00159 family protein [Verrucomicrobiaceae bacterium R5-34]MBK1854117.1 TIGR00159 family protein [Oceaniferula flavus]MBM1135423.1 TIGR00159 family protein [Oceaniferula flavus]